MQLVVRDPGTLARVPIVDVPIDFEREMMLIVTLGRVTSDQYGAAIRRVWREGSKIKVETDVQQPPRNAPPAFASPYCIAVVPRCDLNVEGFETEPPTRARSWEQSSPPAGF
jgi:hypothetical protein